MNQVVQVNLGELLIFRCRTPFDAKHTQQLLREHGGKTGYGIEHHIAQPRRKCKKGQHRIGIALKDSLRQKFTCKKHDESGQQRVGRYPSSRIKPIEYRCVENLRKEDTIDHQGDIVSHEHRGHEGIGMLIE